MLDVLDDRESSYTDRAMRLLNGAETGANMEKLLNDVGASCFVKYYYDFRDKDNAECVALIEEPYTEKSKKSRTSKAKKLFTEGLAEDALKYIAESEKISVETVEAARRLLNGH